MIIQALSVAYNLGISDWTIENIPLPEKALITIDSRNKSEQGIIFEFYKRCYDITADHRNLNENLNLFEILRENYPPRREAKAYKIQFSKGCSKTTQSTLKQLGFHFQD